MVAYIVPHSILEKSRETVLKMLKFNQNNNYLHKLFNESLTNEVKSLTGILQLNNKAKGSKFIRQKSFKALYFAATGLKCRKITENVNEIFLLKENLRPIQIIIEDSVG